MLNIRQLKIVYPVVARLYIAKSMVWISSIENIFKCIKDFF